MQRSIPTSSELSILVSLSLTVDYITNLTEGQAYTVGGIVTGFLITPTLSKYLGRRFCIQLGLAIVIVSTFVQAFAPNMPAFIAGRLLMGMGQGLAVPTGPTYIAETAPAKVRGTMMSFWQGGSDESFDC